MNSFIKNITRLIIFFVGFSVVHGQKAVKQTAVDNFSRGNYELAYDQFNELLAVYPRDPLYKYYSAACLVNLKKDPDKASTLIGDALNSSSLKSLPDDAIFYLARTKQMQGKFDEAERTFRRFSAEAGKKRGKDLGIDEYIRQCKEGIGKVENQEYVAIPAQKPVQPQMAITTTEKLQPLPAEVEKDLDQKLDAQFMVDSAEKADQNKKLPVKAPEIQPETVTPVITADKPVIPPPDTTRKPVVVAETRPVLPETTEVKDTTIKIRRILSKSVAVYSVFEVLPQPVTDPKAAIEINPDSPEGLIYRIQMAVFKNPVQLSYFKGISPIYGLKAQGSAVTVYYAGLFRQSAEAARALSKVKAKGFKDSFVVSQVGNKAVSSERAAVLEKEWGTKPLFNIEEENTAEHLDTVPPTLLLKVEVARSIQPLKDEAIEPMRRMAGQRSFDTMTIANGSVCYLIGNFITFESAQDFAGLLQRNGYRDARVVAWLGNREIDIQTARQLFETLK